MKKPQKIPEEAKNVNVGQDAVETHSRHAFACGVAAVFCNPA